MVFGTLMASRDARLTESGAPLFDAEPLYRFVPGCRVTVVPTCIWKVMEPGATPVEACETSAAVVSGTLKVSLPPPTFEICREFRATPGLQGSCARKTWRDAGMRMG